VRYSYALTPKGTALGEVLLAFVRWGKQRIPGTVTLNQGPRGRRGCSVGAELTPQTRDPREMRGEAKENGAINASRLRCFPSEPHVTRGAAPATML